MAVLKSCTYCRGTVCNAGWHDNCRLAEAEDLLSQVQILIGSGKMDVPDELKKRIGGGHWRTRDWFKKAEDAGRENAFRIRMQQLDAFEQASKIPSGIVFR